MGRGWPICRPTLPNRQFALKPWQFPPGWVRNPHGPDLPDPNRHGIRQAQLLARRLVDAELSKYEPDPGEALAARNGGKIR